MGLIIKTIEMLVLIVFAVYFDIKYCKIKNEIIVAGLVVGVLTSLVSNGFNGIIDSILGLVIPILLLFLLFALKMLGAGDVKLFAAIGSIMGLQFVLYSIMISIMFGGVLAIIIIIIRKNAIERFKHLFNYLKLCLITIKVHEYQEFDKNDKGQFRFSYAIAGGTLIALIVITVYKNLLTI